MKFLALAALTLGVVSAAPNAKDWKPSFCLTDAQAASIVANEKTLLEHYDADAAKKAAYAIYQPNLQAYSDSINALYGDPLGKIVETSLDQYVTETLSTPPHPINTLDIVHDCYSVVWHWEFLGIGNPATAQRIRGFTISKVDDSGKIYREDVEFNSLVWAANTGWTVAPPTTGQYAPSK